MGKGVGHLDWFWSYGVREVVSSISDRGNIVGWVFHPTRCLVRFSLIWKCISFQILNLFRTVSSWGSGTYRPSAPFLYEVASHVKQLQSSHYTTRQIYPLSARTISCVIVKICTLKLGVHTRDCTCLRPDCTVASQSGRDSSASIAPTKARRTYSRLHLFTTRLNCHEPIGSRQFSVHCADWTTYTVTTRSRPSDSLKTADVYAPWCHLVFRHASVTTAVVIGWYLKTGESRFSRRIGCNGSRPGRNTVASDAWPSFKARRRWIGAKSLVCTPGLSHVYTVTTRSRPSDSLKTADVYAPWCHLVFRHASVTTAVVIGWYLKTGGSRFSRRIGCNVSRPGRNTVASDAWPSFKARRRWIGAKSLVCTPGFRPTYQAFYHQNRDCVHSMFTPARRPMLLYSVIQFWSPFHPRVKTNVIFNGTP